MATGKWVGRFRTATRIQVGLLAAHRTQLPPARPSLGEEAGRVTERVTDRGGWNGTLTWPGRLAATGDDGAAGRDRGGWLGG